MKQLFFLLLAVIFMGLPHWGCPDEKPCTTCPDPTPTNCVYPAGNRNFTWRLDTVAWFPSTLGGIHAFSDSDAYLMGYIGEGKPPWRTFVGKHWDGKEWNANINGTDAEVGHVANDVTGDSFFMVSVGNWSITPSKPAIGEFDNRTKKWKAFQFQTQGELRSVWTDGKGYFIAVGDSGMVYTKDGYSSNWVYQKAPTDFSLYQVVGVSKNEIYTVGYISLPSGENYGQCWKLYKNSWTKLFDTQDTTNTILPIARIDSPGRVGVTRCDITDSLKFYVIGNDSYLFESLGQDMTFKKTNLQDLGLPLKINSRSGVSIDLFSPNDYWVIGTRYNFYHWNGSNFQKMTIPGLPNDNLQFGWQPRAIKTTTGKLFFPSEVGSQIYVVAQGISKIN